MNAVQPKQQESTVPKTAVARSAFPTGRWTLFKNPFSRAPKPSPDKSPHQSELSLELVKPVRNDLSDADLELVQPVKHAAEKVVQVVAQSGLAADDPGGVVWSKIKSQLFGAGKT